MTRNNKATPDGGRLTRRSVLRGAGAAAGLAGLGLGATPAAATNRCPRTRYYWADNEWHPHARKHLSDPFELAGVSKSLANWRLFLGTEFTEDKAAMLAQQLLTTKLNLLLRRDPDPDCVNFELEEYGGREVEQTRNDASTWLLYSAFGQGTQECWTVETGEGVLDGYPLYELLARYNHNDLDALDCNCYEGLHDEHDLPPLGEEAFGPCRDRQATTPATDELDSGDEGSGSVYIGPSSKW